MHPEIMSTPHLAHRQLICGTAPLHNAQALDVVALRRLMQITDRKDLRCLEADFWVSGGNELEEVKWFDLSRDARDLLVVRQMADKPARLPAQHGFAMEAGETFQLILIYGAAFIVHKSFCAAFVAEDISSHEKLSVLSNIAAVASKAPVAFYP